jgi:hypothetical protein
MIRVMLRVMRNPTICTTTPKISPCHRLQAELITGTILITRWASIISPLSRSSIDLQSPSPSHSRATSSVIPPMGTALIIRCHSTMTLGDTGSTTSRSQTSSVTSSGVHHPLAADYSQRQSYSRPPTAHGVVQDREGFPSAFGLKFSTILKS